MLELEDELEELKEDDELEELKELELLEDEEKELDEDELLKELLEDDLLDDELEDEKLDEELLKLLLLDEEEKEELELEDEKEDELEELELNEELEDDDDMLDEEEELDVEDASPAAFSTIATRPTLLPPVDTVSDAPSAAVCAIATPYVAGAAYSSISVAFVHDIDVLSTSVAAATTMSPDCVVRVSEVPPIASESRISSVAVPL